MDKRIAVRVSPLFFALLAWLLLYERETIAAGCLAASLIHECGHLSVMLMLGVYPEELTVGAFGMRITRREDTHCTFLRDLCIAAGGPLINLLCAAVFFLLGARLTAALHLVTAALNLLPVAALDGGQMLLFWLYRRKSREAAQHIVHICSLLTVFPLGVLGFFVLLRSGCNVSLLAVDVYLLLLLVLKKC